MLKCDKEREKGRDKKMACYYGRGIKGGEMGVRRRYLSIDCGKEMDQHFFKNGNSGKRRTKRGEINGKGGGEEMQDIVVREINEGKEARD